MVQATRVGEAIGPRRSESARARGCRFCGAPLRHTFVDLGMSPLANSYVSADRLHQMEPFYPLHAYVCAECFLVQLEQVESPAHIFSDYAYFSSYSESWVRHAKAYVQMAAARFALDERSRVVEIASNDGYLLQHFVARGVPVLGIEPAANVAAEAVARGIPTRTEFFGREAARRLADEGIGADLVVANNVLAHVPDLNDFVGGLPLILRPGGAITLEFPHLLRLIEDGQFDTIYHEHFSYFSLFVVERVFASHGLTIFDVDELPTHGGSLRIYARHASEGEWVVSPYVEGLRAREQATGLHRLEPYLAFAARVRAAKLAFLSFLIDAKMAGKTIAAYGAPAKATTLLNYCGVRDEFIDYTVDRSPHKQGHFLPGARLPILAPGAIAETKPDYVVVLPWNLREEIMLQLAYIREWGGRFVVPIPEVTVYE